ncbi:MAG TPA: cysteine desulfurase [Oligoflexia bacterium]|nr:cysteine desulfurase [Oligoflexia bacterium]HMP48323.1 cysteine desulfurase [Oligoflexia bacterium]
MLSPFPVKENTINVSGIKNDFPLLTRNKSLSYLDSASTTQKPKCVIDSLVSFYETSNANAHRGVYDLSNKATVILESARETVRGHIGARSTEEIIFTKSTTESLNIVAHSFTGLKAEKKSGSSDFILLGGAEHHANIVPWQVAAKSLGLRIDYIPILDDGSLDLEKTKELLEKKPVLISFSHISNVLGTINPVKEITKMAHAQGVPVVIDGAQAVSHTKVDVSDIGCDFYAFSGHKAYGPMGIGVLYAKTDHIKSMTPFLTGGGMIDEVFSDYSTYTDGPQKFEAGTQSIADAYGLDTAIKYIRSIGIENIESLERELIQYTESSLRKIEGLNVLGPLTNRSAPIFSFTLDNIHPHDLATVLSEKNIAVRAGHHCSQHTMKRFGLNATTRASFGVYNTTEDIDALLDGIKFANSLFLRN